jgi:hypothetical protein
VVVPALSAGRRGRAGRAVRNALRRAAWTAVLALLVVTLVPVGAAAADAPTSTSGSRVAAEQAIGAVLADPRVARWLERYPLDPTTDADYDAERETWEVKAWSGRAGQIVLAVVDDGTGNVIEAWVGPQVAWKMARGRPGAFGGRTLTSWPVWLGLTLVFLIGLGDLRRPLSLRNLDLVALVAFGASLGFFNAGRIFASTSLAVPPLLYLATRTAWIGLRQRPLPAVRPVWPVWLLLAATLFLVGFRVGLNVQTPGSVIDVGYAGVIGADRILDGRAPWGAMPQREGLATCGTIGPDGEPRGRIQSNGRCETPNPRGDTYGPIGYLVYVPAVAVFGWSGRWDSLPAAHATSIALDLVTLLGLALVGLRLGGVRLAAVLSFAWAAYPFTAYVLLANTNDALMPAALVWGLWLASSPVARGAASALAGWAKLATLPTVPLWLTYPDGPTTRGAARFVAAFVAASLVAFAVLALEPSLVEALRTFWERTLGFQLERRSPFSIWGWGQYHAQGIPDLGWLQRVVQAGALVLAGVAAAIPRPKGPLELAALTAAILLALQLSLTHWFYLYLPWALPFVVLALFLPRELEPRVAPVSARLPP